MHLRTCIWPALLVPAVAFAQTTARPEFEVASIRASTQESNNGSPVNVGVRVDGAQINIGYFTLKDYIRTAYRVKDYQVVAPDWVGQLHFDIAGKLPAGATRDQIPEMLQALLEDRFKLQIHRESREFPVYALIPGKGGAKLKEAPADPDAAASAKDRAVNVQVTGGARGVNMNFGNGSYFNFADNKLDAKKLTMPVFCDQIARFMDRPVVDQTGLNGAYDIELNFSPEDYTAMLIRSAISAGVQLPPQALKLVELGSGDSLATSLATVGLKMDARKAPLPVIVVDKMEKAPTSN